VRVLVALIALVEFVVDGVTAQQMVATSASQVCIITVNGSIIALDGSTQLMPPTPGDWFAQLTFDHRNSDHHICGLTGSGFVHCEPELGFGVDGVNATGPYTAMATAFLSGDFYMGLLLNGSLSVWGAASDLANLHLPAGSYVSLLTANYAVHALAADGTLQSIPIPDGGFHLVPPPSDRFALVASSLVHLCGITVTSSFACWNQTTSTQVLPPPGGSTIEAIVPGVRVPLPRLAELHHL
jgi:hypothetical protein